MKALLKKIMRAGNQTVTRDFPTDDKGVAAVEFALIAPLLVLLFLGTVETSYAVSVDRKISRTVSAIADLVTQSSQLSEDELRGLMKISANIMNPYSDVPCIVISTISIESNQAKVVQSFDNSAEANAASPGSCYAKGNSNAVARIARDENSVYPVPASIKTNGTFLVAAEVEIDHSPIVGFFGYSRSETSRVTKDTSPITLSDQILLRPRIGDKITIN